MLAKFSRPAEVLQRLPSWQHWALADAGLLLAISCGETVERSRWGRRLNRLLRWTRPVGLEESVLFLVGFFDVMRRWLRLGRVGCGQQVEDRLFVGFGAGAEEALFARYASELSGQVTRIDHTAVATLRAFQEMGWLRAVSALMEAHRDACRTICNLPEELAPWKQDFLTFVGMKLGHYSFMRAGFARLVASTSTVSEACVLSADTLAFAAVDAGIPTRYLQHGLIRHSLLLPQFKYVDALTEDEYQHFRKRLPAAAIRLVPNLHLSHACPRRGVLIASAYERPHELERVFPFLDWLTRRGVPIGLRLHPSEDREFWRAHGSRWNLSREDSDISFLATVARLQPRLVVSWYSTALAEALQCDIIPISVTSPDNPNIVDLVYPICERALQWPQDQELVERLLDDEDTYSAILKKLRSETINAR